MQWHLETGGGKMVVVLFMIIISMVNCNLATQSFNQCNDENGVANICKVHSNYSSLDFPTPIPCIIDPELRIQEIVDIDEEKQVIHLIAKLVLKWNDTRINYNFVDGKEGVYHPWYLLDEALGMEIWTPQVYFTKSVSLPPGGGHNFPKGGLWYNHPNGLMFQVTKELSWSCDMDFNKYPYDTQNCIIGMSNSIGRSNLVTLNPPKIYPREQFDENGTHLLVSNDHLQFDMTFKSLPSTTTQEFNSKYSLAQFEITLTRKSTSSSRLVTSYFGPTLIFSILSLVSFCVKHEQVPGRIGLLITLCLITINTFNSVDAPSKRGISFIEIWMIGIMVPIILATIEYGTLLFISKYQEGLANVKLLNDGRDVGKLSQTVDVVTFILLILYQILFCTFFAFLTHFNF